MDRIRSRIWLGALVLLASLAAAWPAQAQIEANLSSYTGENAQGYLNPLRDAFGAALNVGTFRTASIPRNGLFLNLEVKTMVVKFGNADKTFRARTEEGFIPVGGGSTAEVDAPTVVGSTLSKTVIGQGGAETVLPGGLDISSLGLAVPQLTIGTIMGTQAVIRYIAVQTGESEIGDLSLWGVGARHSISQYFEKLPVDLAGTFFYQQFQVGEELIDAKAFTVGVQAGRRFSVLEPYAGLSYDRFDMKVKYESKATETPTKLDVDFGSSSNVHFTAGLGLNIYWVHLHGEVDLASQTTLALGLSLGN